ncbi:hypothetical protein BB561_006112 [Smittium simulii]|uniref:C-CAP/cofactor C-like domain-containing protein n=1 Tax=Smittium simulii TaxID=133385 RepID=A0A2T9Y6M0_9FUNG|nr:hypothetical protein BB561_006112 [Smittium simulii]
MEKINNIEAFWISFNLQTSDLSKALDTQRDLKTEPSIQFFFDKLKNIELLITESQYYLPKYDLKTATEQLQTLKNRLSEIQKALQKKPAIKLDSLSFFKKKQSAITTAKKVSHEIDPLLQNELKEEYIYKDPSILTPNNEFNLDFLSYCWVNLATQDIQALYATNLKSTIIICKNISGSVTIRNCRRCIFFLSAQQIRLENCFDVDIYHGENVKPIIETSSAVRFCVSFIDNVSENKDITEQKSPNWSTFSNGDCGWVSPATLMSYNDTLNTKLNSSKGEKCNPNMGILHIKTPLVLEIINSLIFFK